VTSAHPLVLASASPARLATLRAAGIDPQVVVSGVDESVVDETDPARHAASLAELKARAVADGRRHDSTRWVLGCDSVLALDGEIHGKPADAADAVHRWRRMRGRSGVLHTGHFLVDLAGPREVARSVATTVHFATLSDAEIDAYVATGEPLHVAGAFTVDGLGGPYVERIEGDHHGVVGISLPLLRSLLRDAGVAWHELRS
jgi:septum formation protein